MSILEFYLDAIEESTGKRPKVLMENDCGNLKYPYRKYQVLYDRLYNRAFDCQKISNYIDISSFVATEVGLHNCVSVFVTNKKWKSINWIDEARKDRLTGEFTPLNEITGLKQKIKYLLYRFVK